MLYLGLVAATSFTYRTGRAAVSETSIFGDEVWRGITAPVGVGAVFAAVVVSVLRWWRPVLVDELPVRRWVGVIPAGMLVASLASTNYAGLADRGLGFTVFLAFSILCVGFAEETLFRGIGITALRARGLRERKVALWTSALFGLSHVVNSIGVGSLVTGQIVIQFGAGYLYYLIRRRSGGLFLAVLVHALWDFSLVSARVDPDDVTFGPIIDVLALAVLAVVVIVFRRRITPAPITNAPSASLTK